jgi:hypothetical protein
MTCSQNVVNPNPFSASLKDSAVGEELIADYLLFWLNRLGRFEYVEYMKLAEPIDNCRLMLAKSAIAHNFLTSFKDPERGKQC